MKMSLLGYLFLLIIGGVFYFLFPQSAGPELWVETPWLQPLPQTPFETSKQSENIFGFRTQENAGAIDPAQGVVRWYRARDFVSVSDSWIANYDYTDDVIPLVSLTSQEMYPMSPGTFPVVSDGWVFSVSPDLTSFHFGREDLPTLTLGTRSFASIITFIQANDDFALAGLADGRVWFYDPITNNETFLLPSSDWFQRGQIREKIPAGAIILGTAVFVVYGAEEQWGILWDTQTLQVLLEQKVPGLGPGFVLSIPGFEVFPGVSSFFLERAEGGVVYTYAASQVESLQKVVPWTRIEAFDFLEQSGLGFFLTKNGRENSLEFFLPFREDQPILWTQPFEGTIVSQGSALYWIGADRLARYDLGWVYD